MPASRPSGTATRDAAWWYRPAGCTHFSKIDLKKGYHQVLMNPADIPKTVITMPFGLFRFTCMTFGMRNAGNTFQQLIDRTMAGVDSASPYLDDILVFSKGNDNQRWDPELGTRSLFPGLLSAHFILMDPYRSSAHLANFQVRSSLNRSKKNQ